MSWGGAGEPFYIPVNQILRELIMAITLHHHAGDKERRKTAFFIDVKFQISSSVISSVRQLTFWNVYYKAEHVRVWHLGSDLITPHRYVYMRYWGVMTIYFPKRAWIWSPTLLLWGSTMCGPGTSCRVAIPYEHLGYEGNILSGETTMYYVRLKLVSPRFWKELANTSKHDTNEWPWEIMRIAKLRWPNKDKRSLLEKRAAADQDLIASLMRVNLSCGSDACISTRSRVTSNLAFVYLLQSEETTRRWRQTIARSHRGRRLLPEETACSIVKQT